MSHTAGLIAFESVQEDMGGGEVVDMHHTRVQKIKIMSKKQGKFPLVKIELEKKLCEIFFELRTF